MHIIETSTNMPSGTYIRRETPETLEARKTDAAAISNAIVADLTREMSRLKVNPEQYAGLRARCTLDLDAWRTRIEVRYPSDDIADITPVMKAHDIAEGLALIVAADGPEQTWLARARPVPVPTVEDARREQIEAARARWARLPVAARACYRAAARYENEQRSTLLLVAEALSDPNAADPSVAVLLLLPTK